MFKKLITWLFSRTPKVEPYTEAELAAMRVQRLADALRELPPSARTIDITPARGPKIPPIVQHVRITTYNHPEAIRGNDETKKD